MAEKLPYNEGGAEMLRKQTIKEYLEGLEQKKVFGPGDLVTTVEGPYANQGLMVVEKKRGWHSYDCASAKYASDPHARIRALSF